ncbi:hypothetical protein SAMN05428981_101537 [Bacillus sp. OV194]|nr:hypothetical protein SAMN05428981_101537 [Bacillus sp. OV194]
MTKKLKELISKLQKQGVNIDICSKTALLAFQNDFGSVKK